MFTRCLPVVVTAAMILPAVAAADPVTLGAHSPGPRDSVKLSASLPPGSSFAVGVGFSGASSAVLLSVSGLAASNNVMMELFAYGARSSWNTLRSDVLDTFSVGGSNGRAMASSSQGIVARGVSASTGQSGFGFGRPAGSNGSGQPAGVQPGALYAGGPGIISEDIANATNLLIFTAVVWSSSPLQVTFGFRDAVGGGGFLALANAQSDLSPTPEPASMLLIGTGLAGLAALRRRQRARH